jgi:hypothetical protein
MGRVRKCLEMLKKVLHFVAFTGEQKSWILRYSPNIYKLFADSLAKIKRILGSFPVLDGRHDAQHNDIQPNNNLCSMSLISIMTLSITKLWQYAECHCAEYCNLFISMLSVIRLNVIMKCRGADILWYLSLI